VERGRGALQRRQAARAGRLRRYALAGPEVDAQFWIGVSGPPKLPADIVATWNAALKELLADKAVQEKLLNGGVLPAYLNSPDMKARVERDRATVQKLFGG
jgi:tripartite-type tricarboxylate transporter receptor subunit TctC